MVATLGQYKIGAAPRGQDVFYQIGQVDAFPYIMGHFEGLFLAQLRKLVKKRRRIFECRIAQSQKSLGEPFIQIGLIGIDIDGKIQKVRGKYYGIAPRRHLARLQNIQSLNNQNIRLIYYDILVRHHVIDQMGIGGHCDIASARFDVAKKIHKTSPVIALREALAHH